MENISFKQNTLCHPCHDIISLTDGEGGSWQELVGKSALLPRGWYELAQLSISDRIEFTHLFWLSQWQLPLKKAVLLKEKIDGFFKELSTIEIFLVQNSPKGGYTPLMLYSLKGGEVLFASVPAQLQMISRIAVQFSHLPLPEEYLSFFLIHDGFQKGYDGGLINLRDFSSYYNRFQERFFALHRKKSLLIPFYEGESVQQMQCFTCYEGECEQMSTLAYDEEEEEIGLKESHLIFETFSEWLLYYVYN